MGRLNKYDVKPYGGSVQRTFDEIYEKANGLFRSGGSVSVRLIVSSDDEDLVYDIPSETFPEFLEILRLTTESDLDDGKPS